MATGTDGTTVSMMTTGAREAKPSWFARLVSRAMSRELRAFVVPGEDVARARGLDLEATGLSISATPRHASVLVLVGEMPRALKLAAAVAYAQMPRPRAILAVGTDDLSPLPDPDASTLAEQEDLARGVQELERMFSESAFSDETSDFDTDVVRTQTEYTCSMHPEVVKEEPGSCPICGMNLVPRESAGEGRNHGHEDHDSMNHDEHGGDGNDGSAVDGEAGEMEHGGEEGHGGMDDGHMHHGDMDFMSMIEMTKDLQRSRDGLPMEWVGAPFGPLFPGLPGGLALSLTLDGDAVAKAEARSAIGVRTLRGAAGPAESFVEWMARLDPLSPVAYRVLALRAFENAADETPDERTTLARVGAMEYERAASHLGWLASLGRMLGHEQLASRASKLQLALLRAAADSGDAATLRAAEAGELAELRTRTGRFVNGILRTPFLKRRLGGVATLPEGVDASGPVARARGVSADARAGEEAYRSLGFESVVQDGGDALSRMRVRLEEVKRSLDLALAANSITLPESVLDQKLTGGGEATVETPRGAATLRVSSEDGAVSEFELRTPSTRHLGLVERMADDQEIAYFLVGVASLDISPWEVVL